jgi:hypothetical protein
LNEAVCQYLELVVTSHMDNGNNDNGNNANFILKNRLLKLGVVPPLTMVFHKFLATTTTGGPPRLLERTTTAVAVVFLLTLTTTATTTDIATASRSVSNELWTRIVN